MQRRRRDGDKHDCYQHRQAIEILSSSEVRLRRDVAAIRISLPFQFLFLNRSWFREFNILQRNSIGTFYVRRYLPLRRRIRLVRLCVVVA